MTFPGGINQGSQSHARKRPLCFDSRAANDALGRSILILCFNNHWCRSKWSPKEESKVIIRLLGQTDLSNTEAFVSSLV